MLIVLIRAFILYIVIVFAVRLMGKRQIGQLQPSELVVTILVSNIATLPIEDISIPMLMGVVPILTLVCLDVIVSAVTLKSRRARRLFSGMPKIVIENGKLKPELLRELRFSVDDLFEGLRSQGIFDLRDVEYAVVETTGYISVMLKNTAQPPTAEQLGLKLKNTPPPAIIVEGGEVIAPALKKLGFDDLWLKNTILKENVKLSDIYLMTADREGNFTIIPDKREGD